MIFLFNELSLMIVYRSSLASLNKNITLNKNICVGLRNVE